MSLSCSAVSRWAFWASKMRGVYSHNSVFVPKPWNLNVEGHYLWYDGTNVYYSYPPYQYVLNTETGTWEEKTWNGGPVDYAGRCNLNANYIWMDGDNIYHTDSSTGSAKHHILNKETGTWEPKTWDGFTPVSGDYIWTDGTNTYYSSNNTNIGRANYVLNRETDTWEEIVWSGLSYFNPHDIWTDGTNMYRSSGGDLYVLNKETHTWEKDAAVPGPGSQGCYVWTDGVNFYLSSSFSSQRVRNSDGNWELKEWKGALQTPNSGRYIWTDGTNVYYSAGSKQYILLPDTAKLYIKDSSEWLLADDPTTTVEEYDCAVTITKINPSQDIV